MMRLMVLGSLLVQSMCKVCSSNASKPSHLREITPLKSEIRLRISMRKRRTSGRIRTPGLGFLTGVILFFYYC
jgi:hypothetical protein